MRDFPHSGHDYEHLLERWLHLTDRIGLHRETLCEVEGRNVLILKNERQASGEQGGIYLSAGVHGDECAPVWALLEWVESEPKILSERPFLIFPCLNPHGLIENTRHDAQGIDLNRSFNKQELPLIRAWQEQLEAQHFAVSVNLHEDYDATGIYLYELARAESRGHALLDECSDLIPRESASEVDGSVAENGLLLRRDHLDRVVEELLEGGCPEAIQLFLHHADSSLTFETPSEFSLTQRVQTHRRFLETVALLY